MKNFPKSISLSGRVRTCLEFVKDEKLSGKVVVDIGSSFGWLEKELGKCGASFIGVEPNEEAVSFARANTGSKVEFKVGSALKIPLPDEIADIVLLFDVIEHLPKKSEKNVLYEIRRILKKKGILLLTTPNSHFLSNFLDLAWYFGHRHYTKANLITLLKKNRFKVTNIYSRGNIWSLIYLFWFYIMKYFFRISYPRNRFLEKLDDRGFNQKGIQTIYLRIIKC